MTDQYRTLAGEHAYEPAPTKNSRFLAFVAPATSEEEAGAFLDRVRAEYDDARHVCWAWRLGPAGDRTRSSDDGEPSGSAGRPILLQLEGHEVTDVVAAVVRYFGGVKLGVGGLMRAYGGAAGQCLDRAPVREVVVTARLVVEHPYDCSNAVQAVLASEALEPVASDYGAVVRLELDVPRPDLERVRALLVDRTGGRATLA